MNADVPMPENKNQNALIDSDKFTDRICYDWTLNNVNRVWKNYE
jgi:hypothetical protein